MKDLLFFLKSNFGSLLEIVGAVMIALSLGCLTPETQIGPKSYCVVHLLYSDMLRWGLFLITIGVGLQLKGAWQLKTIFVSVMVIFIHLFPLLFWAHEFPDITFQVVKKVILNYLGK